MNTGARTNDAYRHPHGFAFDYTYSLVTSIMLLPTRDISFELVDDQIDGALR